MTNDDPLAKWRRSGAQPVPAPASATGAPPELVKYEAFGEASFPARLWLKRGSRDPDKAFPYAYLTEVLTDNWSIVSLTYCFPYPGAIVVNIQGECLGPLAAAVISGSAAYAQLFEATTFIDPPPGIAIIREIAVHDKPPVNTTTH
jgi:hypothetical protein